jgi:hypothetical protein
MDKMSMNYFARLDNGALMYERKRTYALYTPDVERTVENLKRMGIAEPHPRDTKKQTRSYERVVIVNTNEDINKCMRIIVRYIPKLDLSIFKTMKEVNSSGYESIIDIPYSRRLSNVRFSFSHSLLTPQMNNELSLRFLRIFEGRFFEKLNVRVLKGLRNKVTVVRGYMDLVWYVRVYTMKGTRKGEDLYATYSKMIYQALKNVETLSDVFTIPELEDDPFGFLTSYDDQKRLSDASETNAVANDDAMCLETYGDDSKDDIRNAMRLMRMREYGEDDEFDNDITTASYIASLMECTQCIADRVEEDRELKEFLETL